MKLYFVIGTSEHDTKPVVDSGNGNFLISYYYSRKAGALKMLKASRIDIANCFLDSGAFSAFTLGVEISLKDYISYIKRNKIATYSNLDDLKDPEVSIRNSIVMQSAGLTPLEVFHTGEDQKYLYKILETGRPFALGGMVGAGGVRSWLDNVWHIILSENPKVEVHGFGLSNPQTITNYPWYSCDSASWIAPVKFARYSVWNEYKKEFYTISSSERLAELGHEYIPGTPLVGEKRMLILNEQIKEYIRCEKYINSKLDNKDFNYLTAQQKLF